MSSNALLRNRDQVVAEINSRWIILTPNGEVIPLEDRNRALSVLDVYPSLSRLAQAVTIKGREGKSSESIDAMQRLEWAGYESASDSGHLRYYPKGMLIHNLIRDWHEQILIQRMHALEVKTPFLYDWSRPDLREQAGTFYEQLYYAYDHTKQHEFVLRFGGDFGQFSMLKDVQLSYRNLPLRIFEYAESFRYQRSGQLKGIQQARNFSFFDIHSICSDFEHGWQEFGELYRLQADISTELGIDYAIEFTAVDHIFNDHKDRLLPLLRHSNRPALVEILSKHKHYWAIKYVFHNEDTYKFFNIQLDFENSALYGITYTAPDGGKQGCTICHTSFSSIQRWMFFALENALKLPEPILPLWLAPTQIRVIPVSEKYIPAAINQARHLSTQRVRVDVDDRNKTVGWRVRAAKSEWVPYIIVYGEQEESSAEWLVQVRAAEIRRMTPAALIDEIHKQIGQMPFRPLLPLQLSLRPIFS